MIKAKPRLVVSKSNRAMFAQIVDDIKGITLLGISTKKLADGRKLSKTEMASLLGKKIAEGALSLKIKEIVFDRGRNRYLGRVKTLAEAARKGGLKF